MRIGQFDPLRLRAASLRLIAIMSIVLPFVLVACGQNDNGGGGGPAY